MQLLVGLIAWKSHTFSLVKKQDMGCGSSSAAKGAVAEPGSTIQLKEKSSNKGLLSKDFKFTLTV
jgi:hypothetical protein